MHREGRRRWRISTLDTYTAAGLQPFGQVRVDQPVAQAGVTMRGTTLTVSLGMHQGWPVDGIFPVLRRAIQDAGGIMLCVSTIIDSDAMNRPGDCGR